MKFYKGLLDRFSFLRLKAAKLTACVYSNRNKIVFFKNGAFHNFKNAAVIETEGFKFYYLNHELYGTQTQFTKLSWRKFTKLQAFL
jgi:hypothetical protein